MYRCVCRDCREEVIFEEYDAAQEFFTRHASQSHEVELLNLAARTEELRLRPTDDG
ncbi:hypothetical protein [Halopelagius longus]|uniref:Uncharacterized protein n=1 Tax=Halopelagius longus TaxID=1236180 RepID=A0A1H1EBY4_9EURY|nr:hypothetical protein [Halopelagius longus]SDQ85666.1 hypothetical protein SAMN05216278_2810 [Halopelagius longus]